MEAGVVVIGGGESGLAAAMEAATRGADVVLLERQYISEAVASTEPINPASTGDGQRMALELGAKILNGDMFGGGIRFVAPAKPSWISKLPPWRWLMRLTYRNNRPDLFHEGRTLDELAASIGPYYALGPVKNYVNFTDGGLAVNERLEVLDSQDRPIPGLFAAGSVGQGGLLLKGHGHHLGWAFTSGRLAGRHAAARIETG